MNKIYVNVQRKIAEVDRNIFGHFSEFAFDNIKGGMYDPASKFADDMGFRTDVIEALKDIQVPVIRFPGGNFVSNYHWEDGVGPKENRKKMMEYAWLSTEDNQLGTVEFIELCRKIGTEPFICCNMGSGTIQEAMNWVEYCNGTKDTHYANLRRSHGYEEPFNVKYWGLGNEVYGPWQMGYMDAVDYSKAALEFAKALKWVDSSIKLVASGLESSPEWNYEVSKKLKQTMDYLSVHHYSTGWGPFDADNYLQLMGIPQYMHEQTQVIKATMMAATNNSNHQLKIAWDEWNLYGWQVEGINDEKLYNLKNAIVTASTMNMFIRNADCIAMGNYSVFVNINGAIRTHEDGLILRPQYYVFDLFNKYTGSDLLDCYTESNTFKVELPLDRRVENRYFSPEKLSHGERDIPFIDAVATFSPEKNKLFISVINKDPENDVECEINLMNASAYKEGRMHTIYHESLEAHNTIGSINHTPIVTKQLENVSNQLTVKLKKHSINVVELG